MGFNYLFETNNQLRDCYILAEVLLVSSPLNLSETNQNLSRLKGTVYILYSGLCKVYLYVFHMKIV